MNFFNVMSILKYLGLNIIHFQSGHWSMKERSLEDKVNVVQIKIKKVKNNVIKKTIHLMV